MRFINVPVDATARTTLEGHGSVPKKKNARGLISTSSKAISQAGSRSSDRGSRMRLADEKQVSGDRVCERGASGCVGHGRATRLNIHTCISRGADCCAIAIKAIL